MDTKPEFDALDAFDQLYDAWSKKSKKKNDRASYRAEFDKRVTDQASWDKVWTAAEFAISEKNDNQPIDIWLRRKFPIQARAKEMEELPSPVTGPSKPLFEPNSRDEFYAKLKKQSLYSIETSEKDLQAAFQNIWNEWPQHSKYSEDPVQAFTAFHALSLSVPLDDISSTCKFYVEYFSDPSSGMIEPYHLGNFLARDKFFEWNEQYRHTPRAEDLEVFNATWAWYPKFPNKDVTKTVKESMSFWFRHVKPEERWMFLSAVKKLRDTRRDAKNIDHEDPATVEKYTPSMVSFIGGAWRGLKYYRIMGGDMSRGCLPILNAGGFLKTKELYYVGIGMDEYLAARLIKFNSSVKQTFGALLNYIQLELEKFGVRKPEFESESSKEAFVQLLYDSAWEYACRPPRVMIR